MSVRSCYVLFVIFLTVYGDDNLNCPDSEKSNLAAVRLKSQLLCDYDKTVRPAKNHKNATAVTFKIILKYFKYEIITSTLSLDSWLYVQWTDPHLTWKPSDYEDISSYYIHTDEIWVPDISVYNRFDQSGDPMAVGSTKCSITSLGSISCVPPSHTDALCIADLTKYPFDTQICTVRYGSWIHKGEEIDIQIDPKNMVDTEDLEENGEWTVVKIESTKHPGVYECCPNTTYPSINVSFTIKRLSGAHVASVIIPAVVCIILTLTSLWISPSNTDRMVLCSVNLMVEFFHLQYVSWMVPLKGDQIPLLVLFARDSLLLCSFTIVFTVVLKNMMLKKSSPPSWISSILSFTVGCRWGQFLFSNNSFKGVAYLKEEEDGETIINNSETNSSSGQDWIIFANILDRLCFISFSITFFVMLLFFIP